MDVSTDPGSSADSDFCQTFGVASAIVGAPMAGATGPELAAAVANAGGLAFLQSARLPPAQIVADYKAAISLLAMGVPSTSIGLGFINWQMTDEALDAAISCHPAVVWLAFPSSGREFGAFLPRFRAAGSKVVCMVQTLDEAEEVVLLGADAVVAQSNEAGGHGASAASLMTLLPELVDRVNAAAARAGLQRSVPVLAAGGIVDGRQVAAALVLGAQGVVIGTALTVAKESRLPPHKKQAILSAGSQAAAIPSATVRSQVFDQVGPFGVWPHCGPIDVDGRALRNDFIDRVGATSLIEEREVDVVKDEFEEGRRREDPNVDVVWAGTGVGLVAEELPAAEIIRRLMRATDAALAKISRRTILSEGVSARA